MSERMSDEEVCKRLCDPRQCNPVTMQAAYTAIARLTAERDAALVREAEAFRAGAEAMRDAIASAAETIEDGGSYILSDMIRALPLPAHQSSTQTGTNATTGPSWKVQASRHPPRA